MKNTWSRVGRGRGEVKQQTPLEVVNKVNKNIKATKKQTPLETDIKVNKVNKEQVAQARIDSTLWTEFKIRAMRESKTLPQLLDKALRQYLTES